MRAELRYLHSPDADPLQAFSPKGPFGILVQAIVGPSGAKGEESFDFVLCTPDWFALNKLSNSKAIVSGRHFVFVEKFDYPVLEEFVRLYCESCNGKNWRTIGEKIGRLGRWEFEDYKPAD